MRATAQLVESPGGVFSDERLLVLQQVFEHGDEVAIAGVAHRHAGVAQQATPLGALKRGAAEAPPEAFGRQAGQFFEVRMHVFRAGLQAGLGW